MSHRLLLLVVSLLIWPLSGHASVLQLDADHTSQAVPVIEMFPDYAGSEHDAPAVLAKLPGSEVHYGQKLSNPFRKTWMRLVLENSSGNELNRILYLPNNFAARSFEFYFFRDGVFLEHKSYGQNRTTSEDEIIGRSNYTSFSIPAHARTELFILVDSGYEPLMQNFQISTRQQFINWEVLSTFFVGLFLGVLFLTMVANLMQAAAYRDKTFLWYAAYCGFMMLSGFSFFGIWVRIFSMAEFQQYNSYFGGNLTLAAGSFFVRYFLDAPKISPLLNRLLLVVPFASLATIVCRFIPETNAVGYAMHVFNSLYFTTLACITGGMAIARGKEFAWLFTVSFLSFAGSIIYLRLSSLNVVAAGPMAFYAPACGQILQITLISFVMFVRGRAAYREMQMSQWNRGLNEKLNLLLKILSHDIANPLQAISLYCNMALERIKTEKLPKREVEKALEAVDTQARILRHAKEAVRQMQLGQRLSIQPIAVSQIIHDLVQVFQPLCQDRGIRLEVENELREDMIIHTDPMILVHSIFGNILSNSIKFSPEGGLIKIQIRYAHRRLIFDLVDNGPGISKDKRVEIFTLNVGRSLNEQLTGAGSFGLSILHMCSELLQGHLDVGPSEISPTGQETGLRISVSLPLHHAL